ncbi:unnamed protein product [Caenorhabditis bovis]|uniref:Uncharacterized protein n=1 Tax=Caenorhabditis bovis TaxID=2654633 RepID=A0A8S1ET99_9PELO|nr:unnamed protein product [Caenorhabditis bovis]
MRYTSILLLAILIFAFTECKKLKRQKVIYVQKTNGQNQFAKQLSAYDVCKMECRKVRDTLSKQEYIEQLRQELEEAEMMLKERESEDIAKKVTIDGEDYTVKHDDNKGPTLRKSPSRFEHLKMAAAKAAETGNELKNAVTGSDS